MIDFILHFLFIINIVPIKFFSLVTLLFSCACRGLESVLFSFLGSFLPLLASFLEQSGNDDVFLRETLLFLRDLSEVQLPRLPLAGKYLSIYLFIYLSIDFMLLFLDFCRYDLLLCYATSYY